jgi:hypothetical protein
MIKRQCYARSLFSTVSICVLMLASILFIMSTRAVSAYHVTISSSNFSLQTLEVGADDLSNPGHVTFHLQNGSAFWYGIAVQSTPAGMTLTPANQNGDLVTTTFVGTTVLLPPANVLPFDSSNGTYNFAALRLAVAFSGPNQQVQLTLSPLDTHAATLDVLTLLLQLLGQRNGMTQIGLLTPNGLQAIFNEVGTMQDFSSLTSDYLQLLQSATSMTNTTGAPNTSTSLPQAYACAKDLVALLTNQSEQLLLDNILWNLVGKVVTRASIHATITSFSGAQFGLGIEGFLRDEAQAMDSSLFQVGNPTVLIQTVLNVTATPTPTQSQNATPTPAVHPTAPSTASPAHTPAATPTR